MEEITFFDRYRNRMLTEKVYGDKALRWTYESVAGRCMLAAVIKRAFFSRWYGWRMDRPKSKVKVLPFIRDYELDAEEFASDPQSFQTFNEFFFRKLKPTARPIDAGDLSAVFPADGRHLCVPDLSSSEGLFVKGEMFDLRSLLGGNQELTARFADGSLLLSRLCPVDYHRFHFPLAGKASEACLLNGPLYSVNPIALRQNIEILATNKRFLSTLETQRFGTVLILEIGATCVGGVCQTYEAGDSVSKGQEKGFFRFGGSSTITIFERGAITFDDDLIANSQQNCELYAKMGDRMGTLHPRADSDLNELRSNGDCDA